MTLLLSGKEARTCNLSNVTSRLIDRNICNLLAHVQEIQGSCVFVDGAHELQKRTQLSSHRARYMLMRKV